MRRPLIRWTDEEKAILEKEWKAGTSVTAIEKLLPGRLKEDINYKRREMGLKKRRFKEVGYDRTTISVALPITWRNAVDRRATERNMASSTYIRSLIARDLGLK